MSRFRPKPYHHGDLRRALLKAARKLVEAEGPAGLSFRRLADAVDVSHAAPLAHFPDRLSLDAALAAQGFREVRSRCERSGTPRPAPPARAAAPVWHLTQAMALPSPSPSAATGRAAPGVMAMRLVTAALVYLRFALEHPGLYRVMYQPALSERLQQEHPEAGSPFRELGAEKAKAFAVFLDLVKQGQEAGEFRSEFAPEQAARLVTALTEGLAQRYLEEQPGTQPLKEAERLLELLLGGLSRLPG